ncbi:hypothetical protein [Kineococcus rhizosphaerae]|uniref:PGAP1-like protein n=1 Tax=Kineococcus rhizosphaerae TaxID=559628 RepID=A0A2T0QX39_9ACTN|nr:hypothetical protein [Kineococcus rhizosphaerae]PRY10449.1 hypothetical protein CLV37_1162 [Kineococcus rhizosphaerae]
MSGPLTIDSGLAADPDQLDAVAARLVGVAAAVTAAGASALAAATDPVLPLSALPAPASAARAGTALAQVVTGAGSATAAAAAVLALAGHVELAALRYRVGDEAADAVVALARRALARVVVEHAPEIAGVAATALAADTAYRLQEANHRVLRAAAGQAVTGGLDLDALARTASTEFGAVDDRVRDDVAGVGSFLAAHPEVTEQLVAAVPDVLDAAGLPVGDVAGAAAALTSLGAVTPLFRETGIRVSPVAAPRATPSRPPRGLAEVLDGVAHQSTGYTAAAGSVGGRLAPAGAPPPGRVRLERVTQADGRVAWIVEIPGTQDWTPVPGATGTPMDLTTNLRAVAGQDTATGAAVVAALRRAGVGPDQPVLLAGHSQGGLTAASLAADPAVTGEFRITHVLTAGSPVDGLDVADGVQVVSLEHTGDVVPALDGQAARGSAVRTVVSRDAGEDPAHPLRAHGWRSYLETARLADASDDPALQRFRRSGSAFFDAPGARVDVVDYEVVRVP